MPVLTTSLQSYFGSYGAERPHHRLRIERRSSALRLSTCIMVNCDPPDFRTLLAQKMGATSLCFY